ncbi:MmgE/PrpD family protein [Belnapia sp. T6]|uniref:MmgE/PrpD family protein n=1 Tax=Belnapia mucosa TaxID=2804532 RepID=A0ABS1VC10_9PROT|nr:MmgE/PrpD family protein [Belnapia mucosa]MBL6458857.1 MmgE/PrpD family protein [Belnapia mucosa]
MDTHRGDLEAEESTARLAGWCATVPRRWSAGQLEATRRAVVDTVAVMLAGQDEACTVNLRHAVRDWGDGRSHVMGGRPQAAPWAALVNGTAAHALDYDDVLDPAMSHPSAVLVPAVLALAEAVESSGADALDAFIVGFEVLARLGEAMNLVHYTRGWHTTLSIGSMGVAAACARLLRLDQDRMMMAISLATSMAGGSKRQFGTMVKPLHAGLAAKNGLVAAQLAAAGVTGVAEPLEGRWGYLELMAGEGAPGMAAGLAHLGDPPAIEQYGAWAKYYPCCASTHRPVDALRSLNLRPEQVATIRAEVSEVAQANLRYRVPRDSNEARFSLPYCLAAALYDGTLTVGSFSPEAIARLELVPLMERIEVAMDPELTGDRPVAETFERGSVAVTLTDGSVLRATAVVPRGHPQAPLTDAELEGKFRDCAARVLTPGQADRVWDALSRFGQLDRVAELTALMRA